MYKQMISRMSGKETSAKKNFIFTRRKIDEEYYNIIFIFDDEREARREREFYLLRADRTQQFVEK